MQEVDFTDNPCGQLLTPTTNLSILPMPAEPRFLNDKLETLVRNCIVFPADGSETRIVHMVARTVTSEDTSELGCFSRCVDMASTFGDDYRKTRVMSSYTSPWDGFESPYILFYNLSPNLPINLNVAHAIGVTPSYLKTRNHLFWRGDVVAMKVQPESQRFDFIVQSLDADLTELRTLEAFLKEMYRRGVFGRILQCLEDD